jgi:phosphoribosylformylglycinamidine synthase
MIEVVPGSSLFPARLQKKLAAIRRTNPGVRVLTGNYLHFIDVEGTLSPEESRVLGELLRYGPTPSTSGGKVTVASGRNLIVVPRLGTISPWSSKATDIAHVCGLERVRRIERGITYVVVGEIADEAGIVRALADRMTEALLDRVGDGARLFQQAAAPRPLARIALGADGAAALARANQALGLALSPDEIAYLVEAYGALERDPTDVELMMFAQANSEHCRHKIFNADFIVDGVRQERSLFQMIRRTTEASPAGVLSAYRDNAAVVEGPVAARFAPDPATGVYAAHTEAVNLLMKVETHNHPTAISPFPGAATGSGGEIRDEGATGRGARPKAGMVGFAVSNLRLPGAVRSWERPLSKPDRIASALDIMIEGPLGGAAFNNEFGRPALCGTFRTFEMEVLGPNGREVRGYHKPIMIAGGFGNIRSELVKKGEIPPGAPVVVLGGPAMLIGLGGGAASSLASGSSAEDLDFASVQRDNPEMQRRCQEVIDRCAALGSNSPIVSIHDVGAGGLSNALPELVNDSGRGARFALRDVPTAEPGLSPLELWCNEAQERYVLAIAPDRLATFAALCARERCPYAVVGQATADGQLVLTDALAKGTAAEKPIDLPLSVLLGKPPRTTREATHVPAAVAPFATAGLDLSEALRRVLRLPTVADKTFLVTIGDRTVGGMSVRDQMVGRWQVPVADAGVTATGFDVTTGEAMAMGERTPVALLDAAASARLAVAEAITNIASAPIARLGDIKLSANWMAAAGHPGEDARLYDAVRAVGVELCPALGIAIPVGKDSLSMRTSWQAEGHAQAVTAPLSLMVTAFAPVTDVRRVLTPEIPADLESAALLLIDLGAGQNRMGGSALAQVYGGLGSVPPDVDDPARLTGFFAAIQAANAGGFLAAYHDRSDGGLLVTLLEMAFASGCGMDVDVSALGRDPVAALFSEELGAVVAVRPADVGRVVDLFGRQGLTTAVRRIGAARAGDDRIIVRAAGKLLVDERRPVLRGLWSETTHAMAALRDDPTCADEEQASRLRGDDPGLSAHLTFDPAEDVAAPARARGGARPRVAILREQGVNGQIEMAAAFDRAGFEAVDVHMTDLLGGARDLSGFKGLAACGGFSYGDVLGAGLGWAKSILFHARTREMFATFFARPDTFTIGVCNGCQMMSGLKEIIPGANAWPRFVRNRSDQFEARLSLVEIARTPSIVLKGMEGSRIPIAVSHGEGRVEFPSDGAAAQLEASHLVAARFVDHDGRATERYPENPNGSFHGITAVTTTDGRTTIFMPHPERVFRTVQLSWHPPGWPENSPWMRLFQNARAWLG